MVAAPPPPTTTTVQEEEEEEDEELWRGKRATVSQEEKNGAERREESSSTCRAACRFRLHVGFHGRQLSPNWLIDWKEPTTNATLRFILISLCYNAPIFVYRS